jgi:hypothetical protein
MGLISHYAKLQYRKWAKLDIYDATLQVFTAENGKIYYSTRTKLKYLPQINSINTEKYFTKCW